MDDVDTGKVDAKKRKVFKDPKGRTFVKQNDKKVYVKKLFTPARDASPIMPVVVNRGPGLSPMINIGKVNAKKRKVFEDSKGRTYVKQGDKKVYVKKLFTPRRSPNRTPNVPARSPMINTEKVNAKKRKVFKDSKGRTYVKQGDKKVYVKKLFTPERPFVPAPSVRERPRKSAPIKLLQPSITPRVSADCSTPAGLRQVSHTCWFNASLNGFVLAEATAKMIYDQIKNLSSSEIVALSKGFPKDTCPITMSKKYIYHYFIKIHGNMPFVGKKGNVSVGLIGKMFTPKRLASPVVKGKVGYHPLDAARQILFRVFDPNKVGLLREWEYIVPKTFSKYEMLYRDGPLADDITPDAHPMIIKSADGSVKFQMSHMVYVIFLKNGGNHAVCAYVCGDKKYLYDSNKPRRLELDWKDPETREDILEYSNATRFVYVAYNVYVRV